MIAAANIPNEYLINYGHSAFLGRFVDRSETAPARGDRVVVCSGRGLEIGIVLSAASARFAGAVGPDASGDLLRIATPDDEAREAKHRTVAERVHRDAQLLADELMLQLTVLDVELLLDGERAVVQALPFGEFDADPLCSALSKRHSIACAFQDMRQSPAEPEQAGCGKPGCGSSAGGCSSCNTGGGCSTGGCSKGKVKSADELTAYFSGLRRQMESQFGRVALVE
jgi:hypothetical protein